MRLTTALVILAAGTAGARAATDTAASGLVGAATVANLLGSGYDIKGAFYDNAGGGAYLVLQKSTSAYLCHSNPHPVCEKLN